MAVVEDGLADRRSFARFNREPNVGVGVMRATGANVVEVCDEVKRRLPELRKMLPPGMEISISTDYSLFIKDDIDEVKQALLLGIVLTAVVTFLFLGSIGHDAQRLHLDPDVADRHVHGHASGSASPSTS